MGISYSPDNPFAAQGKSGYSPDNPFASADRPAPIPLAERVRRAKVRDAQNRADMSVAQSEDDVTNSATTGKILGSLARPLSAIPGAQAVQTGAAALVNQKPYREAYGDISRAEDSVPLAAKVPLDIVGGVAAVGIPGVGPALNSYKGLAAYGALSGLLSADPDEGGVRRVASGAVQAAVNPLVAAGVGKVAGSELASRLLGKGAALVEKVGIRGPAVESTRQFGSLSPEERNAVIRAGKANALDTKTGLTPAPVQPVAGGPDLMGIDVAGPHVVAEAQGAARTVPGREAFRVPFEARDAQAVPSITSGIDDAMVTRRTLAETRAAQAKSDMEKAIEATTGVPIDITPELETLLTTPAGKVAVKSAVRSRLNVPERPLPTGQGMPGPAPSITPIRDANGRLVRNLSNVSDDELMQEYGRLAQHTAQAEGEVSAIHENPAYADMLDMAQTGLKEDAAGVFDPEDAAKFAKATNDFARRQVIRDAQAKAMARIDAEWAARQKSGRTVRAPDTSFEFGANASDAVEPPVDGGKPSLDAEALQLVTRALRRMGMAEAGQSKPAGKAASDAIAAREIRAKLVEALPPEFQTMMDNYRTASQELDALNLGRTPHPLNPAPTGAKGDKSLTDVEAMVAKMAPEQVGAYQKGKAYDLASRITEGKTTPAQIVAALRNAKSPMARELALSGSPIGERAAAWAPVLERQGQIVSGRGPTVERTGEALGMDVLAPTEKWAAVRGLRNLQGKYSDAAKAREGARDAAFANLLTQNPQAFLSALGQFGQQQGRTQAARTAGGLTGGSVAMDALRSLLGGSQP